MFYLFFLMAILLSVGLLFSVIKSGTFRWWAKAFRIVVVIGSMVVFTVYFVQKSLDQFVKNAFTVQVINKLPFPLDFYIIKINKDPEAKSRFEPKHVGIIRNDFYRNEYLKIPNTDEFWIAGYMGKKNLAYFSQHSILNKNEDQIIEIRNYLVQSSKLAEIAKIQIEALKFDNIKSAIWITLDLLLLYLNLALLVRKVKEKSWKEIQEIKSI
jgi:hypothetical protein